jgi:hypothetical protein
MIFNNKKLIFFAILLTLLLNSCANLPGADAKKYPPNPDERVKKNLEEGKGFRLDNLMNGQGKAGTFDFATSNELWRASLDTIDFLPLSSANYSGGIIISDWYSKNNKESIKITLRFLSNEVRSDAIDIKIFYRICNDMMSCTISEKKGELEKELKKEILKKASIYKKQTRDKNFKPYDITTLGD